MRAGSDERSGGTSDGSKAALRRAVLDARSGRTPDERQEAERALLTHALGLPELVRARTVAGYAAIGTEPGTRSLLEALRVRGARVLLPVLRADHDLDWAEYAGADGLRRTPHGLLEPAGPGLGVDAVTEADAVLLPGLAVDRRGVRLGRGGGSYDRALARLDRAGRRVPLLLLLYPDEIVDHVPAERHDRPVTAVVTPRGVTRFPSAAGG
ncbi:5-formyltetrahydrofolate cyclo-ligase [Wenjunlia vitaminophila]|uniref:5-formyltetrahydrofolate cyclo-ligase n=1 Tax=Wenjunlia vitaminophila TaxID=76728 RepID=A0A0T6LV24_WENVI|nr:5-formyltetrahydrofolate cyclo-ligase [Wenjunlia vitaminophila]KRV50007.1 5-formyltetrahydrofolate cyclo-ligase [Wenjunlia vitaminophila]